MVYPRQQGKRTGRVKGHVIHLSLMPKPESKAKTAKYKADEVKTPRLKQIKTKQNKEQPLYREQKEDIKRL